MEEAFFVPCTRLHDLIRAWNVDREPCDDDFLSPLDFEEVELRDGAENGAVDFLHNTDFTFSELSWLACCNIVWMGPDILLLGKCYLVSAKFATAVAFALLFSLSVWITSRETN
jgi:hypothetical protein